MFRNATWSSFWIEYLPLNERNLRIAKDDDVICFEVRSATPCIRRCFLILLAVVMSGVAFAFATHEHRLVILPGVGLVFWLGIDRGTPLLSIRYDRRTQSILRTIKYFSSERRVLTDVRSSDQFQIDLDRNEQYVQVYRLREKSRSSIFILACRSRDVDAVGAVVEEFLSAIRRQNKGDGGS